MSIMNMFPAGGVSPDKIWATGTSTVVSGLNFKPAQIWVFGANTTGKLRSGVYSVTLKNVVHQWAQFTVNEAGAVTRAAKSSNGTGYVTRDGFSDENTGTVSGGGFTLTAAGDGSYSFGSENSSYPAGVTRWFAFA